MKKASSPKPQHFVGRDIVKIFDVKQNRKPVKPTSCIVKVWSPKNQRIIDHGIASINKSEVRYKLPGEYVEEDGVYTFNFDFRLCSNFLGIVPCIFGFYFQYYIV